MGILSRYFLREFLKLFFMLQFVFLSLTLMVMFIQSIDDFLGAHAPLSLLLRYLLFQTPFLAVQLSPVASLIAAIVLVCQMKRHNEILSLRCAGLSVLRISRPLLSASLGLSLGIFLLSELLVPYATEQANAIWSAEISGGSGERLQKQNDVWYKGTRSIYWIRHFDPVTATMTGLTRYCFDEGFRLVERIDAETGVFVKDGWDLHKGLRLFSKDGTSYQMERFDTFRLVVPERPESFNRTARKPDEMGYWQLKRHAQKIRHEGYDATAYEVDMHLRVSFPLLDALMVFLGIPIALRLTRGGTPLAVSLGITACFAYLMIFAFSRSLGLSGALPPWVSAWIANAVFFFAGIYLMLHAER